MVAVKLVVVLLILVRLPIKLKSEADCHLVIVPVYPDKVKTVLLVPEHADALPEMVPPTAAGLTVIVPVAFTLPQPPINGIE